MANRFDRRVCMLLVLLLMLLPLVQKMPQQAASHAMAEGFTTETDLLPQATEAPAVSLTPTEALTATPTPTPERRNGYVRIAGGTTLWQDRACTKPFARLTGTAEVWVPETKVSAKGYLIAYDTKESRRDPIYLIAYVRAKDVTWLSESETAKLTARLEKDRVRREENVWITVIGLAEPEATSAPTPEKTPTPVPATPAPTEAAMTPVPEAEQTPAPTERASAAPAKTPVYTAAPASPTPTPKPVRTAVPMPEATAVPPMHNLGSQIATISDLEPDIATQSDLPHAWDDDMRAMLDAERPGRQLSIRCECADEVPVLGSEVTLHAEVTGYDGLIYRVIWEVDRMDGAGWVPVDGSDDLTRVITVTAENLGWRWRIGVRMPYIEPLE